MAYTLFHMPGRAANSSNSPYNGAKLYFYATGGLTPATVYQNSSLSTPHTNPVVADEGGKFPAIYLNKSLQYRVICKNSTGSETIFDFDPANPILEGLTDLNFLQAGSGAELRTAQDKMRDAVSILDFRDSADTTDAPAYTLALATGKPIHFPAGRGLGGGGAYIIDTSVGTNRFQDGTFIFGDGEGSVIKASASGIIPFRVDSGSAGATIDNVTIRDLRIEGYVGTAGFNEPVHLMHLNGINNWLIENVHFYGFQGDGIYLGSGTSLGVERHNSNVTIRSCVFNGVNNDNRNAVTIIDGFDINVVHCDFLNCTRTDMPGAIDVEPDSASATWAIVRNIRVLFNSFKSCSVCVAFLLLDQSTLTNPFDNFLVMGNNFANSVRTFSLNGFTSQANLDASTNMYNVVFSNNFSRTMSDDEALYLNGGFGVTIENNTFEDQKFFSFGFDTGNRAVFMRNNRFIRCGLTTYTLIVDLDLTHSWIEKNYFINCGLANGSGGGIFHVRGNNADLTNVHFDNNYIEEGGKTTVVLTKGGGYAGTISSNCSAKGNVCAAATWGANNLELAAPFPDQLYGSATSDVASIAAQSVGTVSVTVTGAALGDFAIVSTSTALEANLGITATVTAADTVTVRLINPTAGAIDPANRTYYVRVFKRL